MTNSYLSSDDQSLTPILSAPKIREVHLRSVIGAKESGYMTSNTNNPRPHMIAVENISQGPFPIAHSDLESNGGAAFNLANKNAANLMQQMVAGESREMYVPGRSISVRDENRNS